MGRTNTRTSETKFVPVATYNRTRMFVQNPHGKVLFQKYGTGVQANMEPNKKLIHHAT